MMGNEGGSVTPVERRQRIALTVLTVVLVALGLWVIASFLPALLWAVIITVAIRPLYRRVEQRWPWLAGGALLPAITTLLIALLVIVPLTVGAFRAAHEAHDLLRWLADVRRNGVPQPAWVSELPFGSSRVSVWWQDHLARPEDAARQLRKIDSATLIAKSRLLGSSLLKRLLIFVFTLLALFFLLKDGDEVARQIRVASERLFGVAGLRIGRQITLSLRGTIDGLVLVGIGEGIVMTVVYVGAGVPHPILFGAITAIAAMIPFGAAALFGLAALLLIGQGAVISAIVVIVLGLAVVAVADHFVRPVLIGGATKLPFLWVLLGILGGVEQFGLLGLFIGPAAFAVLMMLWREGVGGTLPAVAGASPSDQRGSLTVAQRQDPPLQGEGDHPQGGGGVSPSV